MKKVLNVDIVDESDWLKSAKVSGSVLKLYNGKNVKSLFVIVQLENQILGYEYSDADEKFVYRWKKSLAASSTANAFKLYPMWNFDLTHDGVDEMIIHEKDGLKVFKMIVTSSGFELLGRNNLFHESYMKNQVVLIGKFYTNPKIVGLMRLDVKNRRNYFYLFKSDCMGKSKCEILNPLTASLELSDAWKNPATRVFLTKIKPESSQDTFVLRTLSGLEFYQFNSNYQIEKIFEGGLIENSLGSPTYDERFFFGNFTENSYQDVLQLNSSGLFLYQYDTETSDYNILNYSPQFSTASGWTSENSNTIFINDFDGDSKSDMIYTGLNGITITSFNVNSGSWENLSGSINQKFSKIIGSAQINDKPIVFLQTPDGSLKHAKISSQNVDQPETASKSNESIKKMKLSDGPLSISDIEQTS